MQQAVCFAIAQLRAAVSNGSVHLAIDEPRTGPRRDPGYG